MILERLFEMEPLVEAPISERSAMLRLAQGAAAEYEAVSRLLRLGHKVAIPVVDDDGVDLVVDYRRTVQVKSTLGQRRWGRAPVISLVNCSKSNGVMRSWRSAARPHIDVFMCRVDEVGWWIIPTGALPTNIQGLALDGRYDCWRDAWHIFHPVGGDRP